MALKKELSLVDIFCIATGAMISSGLFILPGMAFAKAGPAVILAYLLAGLFCVPTLFSMAELSTAMPCAGGDYFYIMRGFGPLLGTIAGFSTWFSLSLKSAFALIGVGAYLSALIHVPINAIALFFCLAFILLNLIGVKEAGKVQVFLVFGLLGTLLTYIAWGIPDIDFARFSPFFTKGVGPIFSTASFVFISYGGLVKVVAMAEEARNPGRDIPLGMIFSLITVSLLYAAATFVMIGVMNAQNLAFTLTPISDAAALIGGDFLKTVVSAGALLAFITTANAGIMSASRYPLGMSRDKLLPPIFQDVSPTFKTPYVSVLTTGAFIMASVLFLKLELMVKVASTVLILLYTLGNLTVILFRESRILSYKPKFYSPAYPYVQILGILGGLFLLVEMGSFILFLTGLFLLVGFGWYKVYVQEKAGQDSALLHAVEKLVAKDKELASERLLVELKDIVIRRDEVIKDTFHKLVEKSQILDIDAPLKAEDLFKQVAKIISRDLKADPRELVDKLLEREEGSSTVLRKGLAVPHIIVEGKNIFQLVLVRAKTGVIFPNDELAHIIFILIGSLDERNLHLKTIAAIAQITQTADFDKQWMAASSKENLRNILLLSERRRS